VNQIAIAKGTASEELDGVHAAHIGLDDSDHLVTSAVMANFAQGQLSSTNANGQTRAKVPVELNE
jgi:hypothetical protein